MQNAARQSVGVKTAPGGSSSSVVKQVGATDVTGLKGGAGGISIWHQLNCNATISSELDVKSLESWDWASEPSVGDNSLLNLLIHSNVLVNEA